MKRVKILNWVRKLMRLPYGPYYLGDTVAHQRGVAAGTPPIQRVTRNRRAQPRSSAVVAQRIPWNIQTEIDEEVLAKHKSRIAEGWEGNPQIGYFRNAPLSDDRMFQVKAKP